MNCRPSVSTASFMLIATENVISCPVTTPGTPSRTTTAIQIRTARAMDLGPLPRSVASDDDVRCLDDRVDVVAGSQAKVFDRVIGDRGGDDGAALDADADIRGRRALLHLDDLPLENIARAQFHGASRKPPTAVLCSGQ